MTELESMLIGNSATAPPANITEALGDTDAHLRIERAPHTIFEELWHVAFWQRLALDRIRGFPSPYPVHNAESLPSRTHLEAKTWTALRYRFLTEAQQEQPSTPRNTNSIARYSVVKTRRPCSSEIRWGSAPEHRRPQPVPPRTHCPFTPTLAAHGLRHPSVIPSKSLIPENLYTSFLESIFCKPTHPVSL